MTSTYDFYLFRPKDDVAPSEVLTQVLAADSGLVLRKLLASPSPEAVREAELQARRASPAERERDAVHAENLQLAEALRSHYPAWVLVSGEPSLKGQGGTGVTLRNPEGGLELRIERDYVHATVPYSHSDARARVVLGELAACVGFLEESRALRTYDPQLKRLIRLPEEFEAILEYYAGAADTAMRPSIPKGRTKPWWKFWT